MAISRAIHVFFSGLFCLSIVVLYTGSSYSQGADNASQLLTISDIHQQVTRQYKGKIVSTRYSASSKQYVVELLTRDGNVRRLLFDAITGKQLYQTKPHTPAR